MSPPYDIAATRAHKVALMAHWKRGARPVQASNQSRGKPFMQCSLMPGGSGLVGRALCVRTAAWQPETRAPMLARRVPHACTQLGALRARRPW